MSVKGFADNLLGRFTLHSGDVQWLWLQLVRLVLLQFSKQFNSALCVRHERKEGVWPFSMALMSYPQFSKNRSTFEQVQNLEKLADEYRRSSGRDISDDILL